MIANMLKKNNFLPTTGVLGVGAASASGIPKATTSSSLVTPKPTATTAPKPAPTPQPAPAGMSPIRNILLNNGFTNDQIGYDKVNNSVTIDGKAFMTPGKVQGGTSYATKESFDNALLGYKTAQTYTKAEETTKKLEELLNNPTYTPGTFNYDPYSDQQYINALASARANADTAKGSAMADLARRGILDSTINTEWSNQIEQDAYGDVSRNLLPQLLQQAYTRFQDSEANKYNAYRNKMTDTASYLKSILDVNDGRQADAQQQWENRYNYGNAIGTFGNGQKTVSQKTLDENTRQYDDTTAYNKEVDKYNQGRDKVKDEQWNKSYELEKTGQANSNSLGWANYNLNKTNTTADNSRMASEANFNKLTDIWKLTGSAPSGLEGYGVQAGTPYTQQKATQVEKYSGMSATSVLSNVRQNFEVNGKLPTDSASKEKMYLQIINYGLPEDQENQVLTGIGLTSSELSTLDKKYLK